MFLNYFFEDARTVLPKLDNVYDIVFLDAFSPQKDATLWTIDFLNLIKNKIHSDSIIVSYSKSTPFRSALTSLGFFVGKTILNGLDMGSVASLNKFLIISPLTDFDFKLINTKSGITYKDPELSLSNEKILLNRQSEQANSNRISHTSFLKSFYNH